MLDVTGFNEYNIKSDGVICNDTRCAKIEGGVSQVEFGVCNENLPGGECVMGRQISLSSKDGGPRS